jgi:hypothetical protein
MAATNKIIKMPSTRAAGTWEAAGNIKGPPGDVAGIPDPLIKNTLQANVALMVGPKLRIVPNATGGQLEVLVGAVWTVQVSWP